MTKAERELLAELKKTTKKATFSSGWKNMTFDEFKQSAPPRRERDQNDPRPYAWRNKKTTSTATAAVQTETTPERITKETVTTTDSVRGGGKVRAKKNRAHESRKKDNDEEEVIQPSYSLDNIQPIITTTKLSPPVINLETPQNNDDFSQPRIKSSASQPKQINVSQTSEFSFSQPKGLNKLNIDSMITPPPSLSKLEPASMSSEPTKTEPTKPLMTSGFGDLIAKQKTASWSCDICMTSNAIDAAKCLACEEPNPSAPKKEKNQEQPKFSFGVANPPNVTAPLSSVSKFSFGKQADKKEEQPVVEKDVAEPDSTLPPPITNGFGAFMALKKSDTWACSICMISNKKDATKCVACEEPNPNAPKTSEKEVPPKFSFGVATPAATVTPSPAPNASGFGDLIKKQKAASWSCGVCMTNNKLDAAKCLACEEPNPDASKKDVKAEPPKFSFGAPPPAAPTTSGFGDLIKKQKEANWSCGICMTNNELNAAKCLACEEPNPNAPKTTVTETKNETPKFSFGVSAPSSTAPNMTGFGQPATTSDATKTFSFGAPAGKTDEPSKAAASFLFGATAGGESTKPATPTFSFGTKGEETKDAPKEATTFAFGAKKVEEKTETPKAPTFSFGSANTTQTTSEPANANFSYAPTPAAAPVASSFSFKKAEPKQVAPAFSFGAGKKRPNPGAAAPVEPAKFSFGGAPKTEAPSFSFGAAAKTETLATPTGLFGATTPATTNAPSFSFGGGAAKPAEKVTKSSFSFNATTSAPSTQANNSMFSPQMEPSKTAFSFDANGTTTTTAPAPPVQNSNQNNSGFNFGAAVNKPSMFQPSAPVSCHLYSLFSKICYSGGLHVWR